MNLIDNDVNETGNNLGVQLNADQTYIIAPGVEITAQNAEAVSIMANVFLYNYGSLFSTLDDAITVVTTSSTIFNGVGGTITGNNGVTAVVGSTSVTNFGSIEGTDGAGIYTFFLGGSLLVENHGLVHGAADGIIHFSGSGAVIDNTGLIEGGQGGILLGTGSGVASIVNNSGTIAGSPSAIKVISGSIVLDNSGKLDGDINLIGAPNNQNDFIVNTGKILGNVYLGDGNDKFAGTGGTSGVIYGGAGDDRIIAGAGGDVIIGGLGKDTLTGGAGADKFDFLGTLGPANVDRITDFSVPQDTIELESSVFTALGASGKLAAKMFYKGAHAHDGNDHIIYNPATGALLYDSNGSAAGGEVKFATLAHHLAMTAADFLVL